MRALIITIMLSAFAIPASAVNFSGKWSIELPDRHGRLVQGILTLNQAGSEVTGTGALAVSVSSAWPDGREIRGGKVEGDTITFYVWIGRDKPVKQVYRGTMSGDEIRFTVTGSPVSFNVRGERLDPAGPKEVTATRTK